VPLIRSVWVKVLRIKFLSILAPDLLFTMQLVYVDDEVGALRQDEAFDACK
jgi:hypothetical protein